MSRWNHVTDAPPDPILAVGVAFNADPAENKVNLGIGAYRDENGKPWVLSCIKQAEAQISADLNAGKINKEYLPMQGLQAFLDKTSEVILGKASPAIKEKRVAVVQSLSGTGALRLCAEFLAQYNPGVTVYVSDPTWGNHHAIFKKAGLNTKTYRYLTPNMGLDFAGMCADLEAAKEGDVFVFHTVAHNPTGVDPTQEQWKKLADITEAKKAVPVFDTAYQGYASGDLEKDAFSVRYFAHDRGMELMVTQSYSKNFGLYGERIGALNVVTKDPEAAIKIRGQLNMSTRAMISNPPLHGARLVAAVLSDPTLCGMWEKELKIMSDRIVTMRTSLIEALKANGCPTPSTVFADWSHITSQIGMFAYTGLQAKHVDLLASKFHIYCTKNGRFSMAGINPGNVKYIADAMKDVLATAGPSDS
ncbi:pyridoxal phosphate-dependent transferase [Baffinella frigidus]|nr:pyridoxal phosphate-dependent transferase [Cryptophyta sp. CCMP2293]